MFGIEYTVLDQPQVVPDLPEMIIPHDKYVVMGDNRDSSFDSRLWFYPQWGFIDRQEVVGRAEFTFWSWNESFKPRFDRMFQSLRYSREEN